MAVAQGYGKTVTSGSVFAFDTGDTRNSYSGEPTANLALFSITSGITFNADYAALTNQVADYSVTYRGRPSLRCTSTGQWNIYKYPRSGNYTATSSTAFTFSWKMKWSDGRVPAFSNGYIYTDANYFYPAVTVTPLEDGWYLCQTTSSGTSSPVYLTGFTTTQYGTCYIVDWQVEAKTHATSFTTAGTTRSATQGLLPLVGNSTIDLTNMSFDSNAQMTFDGTDDYLNIGSLNLQQDFTLEAICYMNNDTSFGIFGQGTYGVNLGLHILYTNGSRGMIYAMYGNDNDYENNYRPIIGKYYHWVFTYNASTYVKQFYANGILQTPGSSVQNQYQGSGQFNIGATYSFATSPANGKIPSTKIYNRALSAGEVRQNYLHYKTRFNLS